MAKAPDAPHLLVDLLDGKGPQKVRFDPNAYPKKHATVKQFKGATEFGLDLGSHVLAGKVLQMSSGQWWPDDTSFVMTGLKSGDVVQFVSEPPDGFQVASSVEVEAPAKTDAEARAAANEAAKALDESSDKQAEPERPMTLELLEQEYPVWLADAVTASGKDTCHTVYETWIQGRSRCEPLAQPLCILGGNAVAEAQLLSAGVTHVLSVVSLKRQQGVAAEASSRFARLVLDLEDDVDADLLGILPEVLSFVDGAATSRGLCYIHCEQGRSRSASVVIAWLMHRQKQRGLKPSLLNCFAAVASRRRISALNYGFFARLCDFEASLGSHPPSLPLLSFFMLQFLAPVGMWNFKPPPDIAELRREYGVEPGEADEFGCPPTARIRCLRKMLRGFDFVLRRLSTSSQACKMTLLQFGFKAGTTP